MEMISKRLSSETKEMLGTHIIDEVFVKVYQKDKDDFIWIIKIEGPTKSPYENGLFRLVCKIPKDYPFKSPDICFSTPIYHPYVCDNGKTFCGCFYKENWSPSLKMSAIIEKIVKIIYISQYNFKTIKIFLFFF